MAFHLGSLGFLTPFNFENFQSQVNQVIEGKLEHPGSQKTVQVSLLLDSIVGVAVGLILFFSFMCVGICLQVCLCTVCVPGALEVWGPLGLELQIVVT